MKGFAYGYVKEKHGDIELFLFKTEQLMKQAFINDVTELSRRELISLEIDDRSDYLICHLFEIDDRSDNMIELIQNVYENGDKSRRFELAEEIYYELDNDLYLHLLGRTRIRKSLSPAEG